MPHASLRATVSMNVAEVPPDSERVGATLGSYQIRRRSHDNVGIEELRVTFERIGASLASNTEGEVVVDAEVE